jgi:hypothetical protein
MRNILAAFALLIFAVPAMAQQGTQFAPGQIFGNDTAAARSGRAASVSAILDRALGSTRGSIIERGASGWVQVGPGATAGLAWISGGTGADPAYGILPLSGGGTGANVTGVSGGVPYFSSTSAMASSALLTANRLMIGGGAGAGPSTIACATSTTVLHGGTPPSCSALAYADIATAAIATSLEYAAGTASKLVQAGAIYPTETTTTYGTTTTFDFSTFINTAVTLTGNITTMNVSNVQAGKAGMITFIQDGTGSRTTVWNSVFKFPGGAPPTLSTAAGSVDILFYSCRSVTNCPASLNKAFN